MSLGGSAFTWLAGFCPDFEHPVESRRRASRSSSEDGHVIRKQVWDAELRRFGLVWNNGTDGHRFQLLDYWRRAKGTTRRFTYTPQDGSGAIEVCFAEPIRQVRTGPLSWQLSAVLEEHR